MNKLNLALCQFGNSYGGQQALPLSVGVLWAYARYCGLNQEYDNPTFLYKKESISRSLTRITPLPDVISFSDYIWSHEYNTALAKAVKELSPKTTVVFGGVHIPDHPDDKWFDEHPECDYLLHGEGELSFTLFLKEFCTNKDWSKVPGLSCRDLHTERKFPPVEELRSPYTDGVFDCILPLETKWTALLESNRGCPFECHFCQWGTSALNKIRVFPIERIKEEIEWFGVNKISYIESCDANFGILARDVQIAEILANTKYKHGFPHRFRAAFAKYSNKRISEQIFTIASILKKSDQLKAVTMALQSTDEKVLENIERKNISMSGFKDFQERYRKDGIPTYIEVIIGLPGETYQTFKKGLCEILDAGGHSGIAIYMCMVLPNSEMSDPRYIEKYGIKTVPMRSMLLHGTPNKDCPDEIQESIIETKDMPHEDWKKTYMLSWTIQTFHTTGLTQWWAIQDRQNGIPYTRFYEDLISIADKFPETVLGKVYNHTKKLLEGAITGGSWDNVLPKFGDISWPPDEGAFLMVVQELKDFYRELELLMAMPEEQIEHGPPPIPQGKEEDFGRILWFQRKGALVEELRKFCDKSTSVEKE